MATWKKVVVSGSGVSQLLNDAGYVASVGGGIISSSAEGDAQGQIKLNGVNVDANNLGTNDTPQFVAIEVGNASDTTLSRVSAGLLAVEGNNLLRAVGDSVVSGSAQIAINSTTGTLNVNKGGTGTTTLSSGQVLIGNGTSAVTTTAIGISDNNIVAIDSTTVADNEYARFTATGLESRTAGEVYSDITAGTGTISGSSQVNYGQITGVPSGIVSASSLSSPSQGTVTLTTNGVAQTPVDLGLQTGDSPQFVGLTLTGDAAVNGGDITTTATTFNLVNATATTVNFAGASTATTIGATTGTITARGGTLVGNTATQNLFNTTATTINFGGAAGTINIGNGTSTTNIADNLVVAGDLTVQGTTTSIQTANLNVEDQFILLNSGSATGDGGIIVQTETNFSGQGLGWKDTSGRWGLEALMPHNDTAINPKNYLVSVSQSTLPPVDGNGSDYGGTSFGYGNMHITTGGDIYIFS